MKVSDGQKLTLCDINKNGLHCDECSSELEIEDSEDCALSGFAAYACCNKCKIQYEMFYDSVTVGTVHF